MGKLAMMTYGAAKRLGKAMDEKARKVLTCEHAVRPAVEMTMRPTPWDASWLAWYGLKQWACPRCHRQYVFDGRWRCYCR